MRTILRRLAGLMSRLWDLITRRNSDREAQPPSSAETTATPSPGAIENRPGNGNTNRRIPQAQMPHTLWPDPSSLVSAEDAQAGNAGSASAPAKCPSAEHVPPSQWRGAERDVTASRDQNLGATEVTSIMPAVESGRCDDVPVEHVELGSEDAVLVVRLDHPSPRNQSPLPAVSTASDIPASAVKRETASDKGTHAAEGPSMSMAAPDEPGAEGEPSGSLLEDSSEKAEHVSRSEGDRVAQQEEQGEVDTTKPRQEQSLRERLDQLERPTPSRGRGGQEDSGEGGREQELQGRRPSRRIAPVDRGGHPRGSGASPEANGADGQTKPRRPMAPRPEFVCWKKGMAWALGVEISEDLEPVDLEVRQNTSLREDGQRPLCFPLEDALGEMRVRWKEAEHGQQKERTFSAEPCRIFKLMGDLRSGRHMNRVTRGPFLIVVPESWQRHVELSGREFLAPEPVLGGNVRAHHFDVDGKTVTVAAFITPESRQVQSPSQTTGFELEGHRVPSVDQEAGPLFIGDMPYLRSHGASDYATVVVGEEGPWQGRSRWRDAAEHFAELRSRIRERGAGWYFVRLYDAEDQLLESLDFRYSKGFEGIKIDTGSPMPGPEGHRGATVRFRHDPSCSVQPAETLPGLEIARDVGLMSITVPPDVRLGQTQWTILEENNRSVEIAVVIERIWWALAYEDEDASLDMWTGRPLQVAKDDLDPTSTRTVRVKLPAPGWASAVKIGFDVKSAYEFRASPRAQEYVLPLRNLGGRVALAGGAKLVDLLLWVQPRDSSGDILEGVVAHVRLPEDTKAASTERRLVLADLCPPRLMSIFSRLRRRLPGSLRGVVSDLRREHYHQAHREGSTEQFEFLRQGLCLLAALLARKDTSPLQEIGRVVPSRWARRAQAARARFPELFLGWEARVRDRLRRA